MSKMYNRLIIFITVFILTASFNLYAEGDTTVANSFLEQGIELFGERKCDEAKDLFVKSLDEFNKIYQEDHADLRDVYLWLGKNEFRCARYRLGLQYLEESLALSKNLFGEQSLEAAECNIQMAHSNSRLYRLDLSELHYNDALEIHQQIYGEQSKEVANLYMDLGVNNAKRMHYHDASFLFNKAYDIYVNSEEDVSTKLNNYYNNYGIVLRKMGNYEKSLEFAKKALAFKKENSPENHPVIAKYYSNVSKVYLALEAYDLAIENMQAAIDIYEFNFGKNSERTAYHYLNLGSIYGEKGNNTKALKLYDKAIKAKGKSFDPSHPFDISCYFNSGIAYQSMKKYDLALEYFNDVIALHKANEKPEAGFMAQAEKNIADLYFETEKIDEALKALQRAYNYLDPNYEFDSLNFYNTPSTEKVQDDIELLNLLENQAKFLKGKYEQNNVLEDLKQALRAAELSIDHIATIRSGYQSYSAKIFLNSKTDIYKLAVSIAYQLYKITDDKTYLLKALKYSEVNKASILRQSLNEGLALYDAEIPSEQVDSILKLNNLIDEVEEAIYESELLYDVALNNKLLDLKKIYEVNISNLEKSNPEYYNLKYSPINIDIEHIVKQLPASAAAIEYFYDEQYMYTFVITKEGLTAYNQKIDLDLLESVNALKNNSEGGVLLDKQHNDVVIKAMTDLYGLLIQPIEDHLKGINNVVIVPHGILQYLSFDLLAPDNNQTDFRKFDYLIRRYDIQYAWSLALWLESDREPKQHQHNFVGFANDFKNIQANSKLAAMNRSKLGMLENVVPEVQSANTYFSGKVFLNSEATESQFCEIAPQSKIIHLATHALVNDEFPLHSGLLFNESDSEEDGFLNLLEIYNSKLPADLAVISACNTGFGKLVEGEGVMSLGRAFMYAGCKSILMSLWLANDASTSEIMKDFYKYASKGNNKQSALRLAKLDYLNSADALTAHPYYWANMIAVGDMQPLNQKSNKLPWIVVLSLAVLSSTVWFWRRRA